MEPVVLMLVLLSAFFHALWNALLKRHEDPEAGVVGVITVDVVLGALWALGLRGEAFPTRAGWLWGLSAGVCEGLYLFSLARSLSNAPLGLAYTVARGGALLLVWPVSVLWLGEALTSLTVAGALVLSAGLGVTGLVRPSGPSSRGVVWAAASAVCIAGYHVSYKQALGTGAQPPALFALGLGVALPMLLFMHSSREKRAAVLRQVRLSPWLMLATGTVSTLSFALLLTALAGGGAGAVLTLRNTSIAFALGLAMLQGERPGRRQLSGAVLVMAGAVLLGWPA
ncbi:EamA family transporter [Hyalangium minutum]|uniref:Integral membrane protein n=1 Tax=Hyalangium minutum TaxID=394096 RepID=A0A085WC46_9BACT|nr:EamA family transporter [Hyalangium minutum]KFE65259.1 Integral membrane protein [Hyalangium minutum]